jgi:hypothetical protein
LARTDVEIPFFLARTHAWPLRRRIFRQSSASFLDGIKPHNDSLCSEHLEYSTEEEAKKKFIRVDEELATTE